MSALPDYPTALARALGAARPLARRAQVPLAEAGGRVLAEPVIADRDLPPFPRAQMDGYALRCSELGRQPVWPVAATIPAGQPADVDVPEGSCVAIATGAPLPRGLDTVIQHELSDRGDPVRFTIDSITAGHAVHPRGADARAGETLLQPFIELRAQHLGIAAMAGRARLEVIARPRVAVLTSGDEVVPVEGDVLPHQIRNSNGPMLAELLARLGAEIVLDDHVPDARDASIAALGKALGASDVTVTVGGISAGDRDFFHDALRELRIAGLVQGASIQPGRPVAIGRGAEGQFVVGLPGNPVSALVCGCLFAWPLLRVLSGLEPSLPWREVEMAEAVRPNAKRQAFRPASLRGDDRAVVPSWAGSGDLVHTAETHGVVALPVQSDEVTAGTPVQFLPWP